jgi:hypothetical protein
MIVQGLSRNISELVDMKDSDVNNEIDRMTDNRKEDLVYRLRKRAEIRRQIPTRKSVQENQPDRLADLLEEAATEIERLRNERTNQGIG